MNFKKSSTLKQALCQSRLFKQFEDLIFGECFEVALVIDGYHVDSLPCYFYTGDNPRSPGFPFAF